MRHSAQTDLIDAAMSRVQSALEIVKKNKDVKVDSEKAKWSSRFATFDVLYEACREKLAAEGVAVYQGGTFAQGGGERLVTRLALNGQWIESDFPIKPSRDGSQGFGGGISFAKRWGLMGMVGLATADDPDEKQGYQDERAKPRRAASPQGLPALLDAIRVAETHHEFAQRVAVARGLHPTGEGAAAVEKQAESWLCDAIASTPTLDDLTLLRDLCTRVRPRGTSVRTEIAKAEARIMGAP